MTLQYSFSRDYGDYANLDLSPTSGLEDDVNAILSVLNNYYLDRDRCSGGWTVFRCGQRFKLNAL
ncbi:hypothetical protein Q7C36_010185 [Tachysurus vachellii]|uniref:Uncharacterized protein n=1 Tax=Tachysurus vachellii TaxID=175792 RepID=A0AA88MU74_TACVA|nr:hypothetical protein Q7C36_010185 [Tachysurus vachellii]